MLKLTQNNFQKEVLESPIPVLVDFYAPWCGPCQMMLPVVEKLAKELEGKAKISKVNVDEQGELAEKYEVLSVPTFLAFKDGKEAHRTAGAQNKEKLKELLS